MAKQTAAELAHAAYLGGDPTEHVYTVLVDGDLELQHDYFDGADVVGRGILAVVDGKERKKGRLLILHKGDKVRLRADEAHPLVAAGKLAHGHSEALLTE